ncbi:MAG: xylulokinase [Polyangiaceae bacterium]
MSVLIGIDVGTSGLKAVAIDAERGATVAVAARDYPLSTPRAGWAEQDAEDFATGAFSALRELTQKLGARIADIAGVGLTGQMHSAVLLDEQQRVVRPAILWCDVRTSAECRAIRERLGDDGLARAVGNQALEGFTLPKLLWVRAHEPERWAEVRTVLMPKDFVGLRLTGELGADVSDASGTLAFDPGQRCWSDEVLRAFDLAPSLFPPVGESASLLGRVHDEAARATGLPVGTPVVRGAADNAAGAVGLGVVRAGRAMASVGTSGVVLAHSDGYFVEPRMRLHSFCHAVPGRFYLMGVMLAAGGALRWYRDTFCDGEKLAAELRKTDPYEIITEAASTSKAGAGGVVFLPYLMGERTPHNDAGARAALVGMSARTGKADVSRAVLEGITFGLRDSLDLVRDVDASAGGGQAIGQIRLTGGGARSAFWRQLMADVFATEVALTSSTEGPAFGAAILAGAAIGVFASVEEGADALVHVTARTAPRAVEAERYREIHAEYRALYGDLRARFGALARFD